VAETVTDVLGVRNTIPGIVGRWDSQDESANSDLDWALWIVVYSCHDCTSEVWSLKSEICIMRSELQTRNLYT
jgi:hypothetical protein